MKPERSYTLSIGGNDPSAGAGILADVKTFEQVGVYGMAAVSAITCQDDKRFEKVEWLSLEQIMGQVKMLQQSFPIGWIKIGLIKDLELLVSLLEELSKDAAKPKLIWDPVLSSSTGFVFHREIDNNMLRAIAEKLFLLTPNIPEAEKLGKNGAENNSKWLSSFCNVYLKGGHHESEPGSDKLFYRSGQELKINSEAGKLDPKHGSGCVFSSALTAYLAKGLELETACRMAKNYTEGFLQSNTSLLGYHSGIMQEING